MAYNCHNLSSWSLSALKREMILASNKKAQLASSTWMLYFKNAAQH